MKKLTFRMVIPDDITDDILTLAKNNQINCSAPQPADSDVEPLNAPITGSELMIAAQIITAVFSAGTAGIIFFTKLKELLSKKNKIVRIINSEKKIDLTISGNVDEETIRRLADNV